MEGGIIREFTRYIFVLISPAVFSPHHRVRFSPGFSPVPERTTSTAGTVHTTYGTVLYPLDCILGKSNTYIEIREPHVYKYEETAAASIGLDALGVALDVILRTPFHWNIFSASVIFQGSPRRNRRSPPRRDLAGAGAGVLCCLACGIDSTQGIVFEVRAMPTSSSLDCNEGNEDPQVADIALRPCSHGTGPAGGDSSERLDVSELLSIILPFCPRRTAEAFSAGFYHDSLTGSITVSPVPRRKAVALLLVRV